MIDVENGITPPIIGQVPGGPWYAVDDCPRTLSLTLNLEPGILRCALDESRRPVSWNAPNHSTWRRAWSRESVRRSIRRTSSCESCASRLRLAPCDLARTRCRCGSLHHGCPQAFPDCSLAAEASASSKVIVRPDGTVAVPGFEVPLSTYMSEAAKQRYMEEGAHPALITGSTIAEVRKAVDDWYRPKVERAKKIYPVEIAQQSLAGVRMAVVTPADGVSARNRDRVLLNLHGGGFATGAGNGGLAESIPVAALGRMQVLSIDYRMGPEYRFPAATEDVVSVYRELLKTHSPASIGIYGCSAGALLTAQVVAWLQKENLPAPGAIGIFCLGADALAGGDSRYLATSLEVSLGPPLPPPPAQPNPPLLPMQYLDGVDLRDPLVSPVFSRTMLARFPPTLLISGSRDLGLSSIVHTHAELTAAGADASLHVWEGMGHNFLVEMDLPESREAYAVIVRHFDRHLRSQDAR